MYTTSGDSPSSCSSIHLSQKNVQTKPRNNGLKWLKWVKMGGNSNVPHPPATRSVKKSAMEQPIGEKKAKTRVQVVAKIQKFALCPHYERTACALCVHCVHGILHMCHILREQKAQKYLLWNDKLVKEGQNQGSSSLTYLSLHCVHGIRSVLKKYGRNRNVCSTQCSLDTGGGGYHGLLAGLSNGSF